MSQYKVNVNRLDKRLVMFRASDPAQQEILNDLVKFCPVDGFNQPNGEGKMRGTASFLQAQVERYLAVRGWSKIS